MTTHYRNITDGTIAPAVVRVVPGPYQIGLKRVFDIAAVVASLPFILPLMALLIALVAIEGRPVFFCQERIGRKGRVYRIWKLRTMESNAQELLEAHLASDPAAAREWEETQKLKVDPRITPIGRYLRKCSLDELPQLWNVLKGDMSLVGPRPMMVDQKDMYPGEAYYMERPGITGPWQVSERNDTTFADRARFDAAYVSNVSFANDLRLLMATVRVVFSGTGY